MRHIRFIKERYGLYVLLVEHDMKVVLGICDELQLPVRFVGVGEKVADLREFDPEEFVDALFEREEVAA